MTPWKFVGAVTLTIAVLSVCNADYSDEVQANERYCQQVAAFESSHLPKLDRPGHPNYKEIQCTK